MPSTKQPTTAVKFLSLPIGERFHWQGAVYVKTSPLIARDEASGKTQLIQRAALVEPLDVQAIARTAKAANASQAVLEEYHRAVSAGLDKLASSPSPQNIKQLQQHLTETYRRISRKLSGKN